MKISGHCLAPSVAGCYCQLLSGDASMGPCLNDKILKIDNDRCWWCDSGELKPRHHLFTRCRVWAPQARKVWKDIGKACGWKHPRAFSVKWLWKERATEAVLGFLRDTRVGCMVTIRKPLEEEGGRIARMRRPDRARSRMYFPLFGRILGEGDREDLLGLVRPVWERKRISKKPAAAMALRAACSGIPNKR